MKNKAKGFINKLLYDTRLALKLDRKQASKLLHITKLHLKLIELGYWSVSKKLQPRFVQVYKLDKDFFKVNSTIVEEINPAGKDHFSLKAKRFLKKKLVRYTSLGLLCAGLGCVGYGIYRINKTEIKPTEPWTDEFKTFNSRMKEIGDASKSIILLDTVYTIDTETKDGNNDLAYAISTYEKDINSSLTNFSAYYVYNDKDSTEFKHLYQNSVIEYDLAIYNKKKILYCSFVGGTGSEQLTVTSAVGVLTDTDEGVDFYLRPFTYTNWATGLTKEVSEGNEIYNEFQSLFFEYASRSFSFVSETLKDKKLGYDNAADLVKDVQKISRYQVLNTRVGTWMTILATAFSVVFATILSMSFYFYYQHRKKDAKLVNKKLTAQQIRLFYSDNSKYKLFIPEFVMRIIGILIVLISSIFVLLTTYAMFTNNIGINRALMKEYSSNFMVAGVMLLFFIKLDIYAKRSSNKLLSSTILFFAIGVIFYVSELVVYYALFGSGEDLFSQVLTQLSGILPGNMFWNLALYALLFYFLFSTPNKFVNDYKQRTIFRSMAAIPTIMLIFSLVWTLTYKNTFGIPYWLNFMFYSKSIVLTVFVLVYIYSLFTYQQICKRKYGRYVASTYYFNTRKYYFIKNSMAASIATILLILELCFRFLLPGNSILGNYWSIGILIPLIMFYHPHIGIRNKAWDNAYLGLYGVSIGCSYFGIFIAIIIFARTSGILFMLF